MAVVTTVLIPAKQAENSQTAQYTATNVTAMIDTFSVHNSTGTAATFAINLVNSGGSAGASNLFLSKSIAAGQTYTCPEVVGQALSEGDFISTLAGTSAALTIRCTGRVIT